MKILKSTSLLLSIIFAIASIHGLEVGLPLLLLCLGFKELLSSKEYYDKQPKKFSFASIFVGIFVCICAFLSLAHIV